MASEIHSSARPERYISAVSIWVAPNSIPPLSARIEKIGFERWPRSNSAPARGTGLDDRPRPVTDDGDRLVGVEETAGECHGLRPHPETVRIHDAAGKQQGIEVFRQGS